MGQQGCDRPASSSKTSRHASGRNIMNRRTKLTLTTMALLCLAVALPAGDVLAQQPEYPPQHREYQYQRVSFKPSAANSKYTQHYNIDVGDAAGHQVRVFEIHRTFPSNAPAINAQSREGRQLRQHREQDDRGANRSKGDADREAHSLRVGLPARASQLSARSSDQPRRARFPA